MKYIITESKLGNVVKKYIESYYGDVTMSVEDDGYLNFFSPIENDNQGYRKRIAHRNLYGTLWIDFKFLEHMVNLFGTDVGISIMKYFKDYFAITKFVFLIIA